MNATDYMTDYMTDSMRHMHDLGMYHGLDIALAAIQNYPIEHAVIMIKARMESHRKISDKWIGDTA